MLYGPIRTLTFSLQNQLIRILLEPFFNKTITQNHKKIKKNHKYITKSNQRSPLSDPPTPPP